MLSSLWTLHISSDINLQRPKDSITICKLFTCMSSGLIASPAAAARHLHRRNWVHTERTFWGNMFGANNKSALGFPVAEHCSSSRHTAANTQVCGVKLCGGNKQRKRQEISLIFQLATFFTFLLRFVCMRPREKTFQILNIILWHITNKLLSPDEGQSLKRLGYSN